MAEYIERKALEDALTMAAVNDSDNKRRTWVKAIRVLNDLPPAADVAPVVHARWEWVTEDKYRCTNCGRITRVDECMGKPMYNGCPYCLAKMDLMEDDDE